MVNKFMRVCERRVRLLLSYDEQRSESVMDLTKRNSVYVAIYNTGCLEAMCIR